MVPMIGDRTMVSRYFLNRLNGGNSLSMPRYSTPPLYSLKGSSASMKISETANKPTMATTKLMPPSRVTVSKVKRSSPVMPSVPMVARNNPKKQERNPFSMDPPERPETTLSPRTVSAKYSAGPNFRAKLAIKGVATIMNTTLKVPP